jgi:cell division protease FtsH
MSERIGMVQLAPRDNPYLSGPEGYVGGKPFSDQTAEVIDAEVARIIHESHEEALRLLHQHRPALDALARALLERETLNEEEILEVTGITPRREPTLATAAAEPEPVQAGMPPD